MAIEPLAVFVIALTIDGPGHPHKIVDHQIHHKTIINVDRLPKIRQLKMGIHQIRGQRRKESQRRWIRMSELKPKMISIENQMPMMMNPTIRMSKRKLSNKWRMTCLRRAIVTILITRKAMASIYSHRKRVNRRMKDDSS